MFDYKKFENDVVRQMGIVLENWISENDDLYILSLNCTREMDSIGVIANTTHYLKEQIESDSEDYFYYKYCEDEWDLFDTFEDISADMCKHLNDNNNIFTNPKTYEYLEPFNEHCDKIIECCKAALNRFKQSINGKYPHILLTFNISEYLDGEERIEIFKELNSQSALKEYSEHIEDFV